MVNDSEGEDSSPIVGYGYIYGGPYLNFHTPSSIQTMYDCVWYFDEITSAVTRSSGHESHVASC